ncbi:MAG: RidA family protein [Alphaproteobacteria bacterium]|nr:RidA family protein [Alphaproteobacteria bacterium]
MAAKKVSRRSPAKAAKSAARKPTAASKRPAAARSKSRSAPAGLRAVKIVAKDAPGSMANHVYPFAQGWRLGNLVFTGGIAAEDPKTGKLAGSDIVTQSERVFQTLKAILEEAGSSLDKVLKVNVFFVDFADKAGFETVYGKYFPKNRPGRTSMTVTKIGHGTLLELDAIAYV